MASSVQDDEGHFGFQIAPMVDVVFVLMLFFMATVSLQVAERGLPTSLSGTRGGQDVVAPIIIQLSADGQVMVNGSAYDTPGSRDLPQLTQFLSDSVKSYGGKDPVIVRPDGSTSHERVMDVLNAAAAAKVTKIGF